MILELYAIKDEQSGYQTPVPMMNVDLAKRWFHGLQKEPGMIHNFPRDFSVWKLGSFNTDTGNIENQEPELIERGVYIDEI